MHLIRIRLWFFPHRLCSAPMTQESREALIELLFLSLYLDEHLSLTEDEVLGKALESLGWDSPKPRESFILSAFAAARNASNCAAETDAFLATRAALIKSDGQQGPAMTWLHRVLASDGISPQEQLFLTSLEKRLYS
jgi:hypothetical protein